VTYTRCVASKRRVLLFLLDALVVLRLVDLDEVLLQVLDVDVEAGPLLLRRILAAKSARVRDAKKKEVRKAVESTT